jgi:hypothetical protein
MPIGVAASWRAPRISPPNRLGEVTIDEPVGLVRGRFVLGFRQNLLRPHDFSLRLTYFDLLGRSCNVVRCNGPHDHQHVNANDPDQVRFSGIPHVHTLTVRYLNSKWKPDHFAEPTDQYDDVPGAIEHLAKLVNLTCSTTLF